MDERIEAARRHIASLREMVRRHAKAGPDRRALRRLLALCQAAGEAVDDDYCRAKLQLASELGTELFASGEHGRWRRDSMSGTVFLALQVLNALELCSSRLYSLEAVQRAVPLASPVFAARP